MFFILHMQEQGLSMLLRKQTLSLHSYVVILHFYLYLLLVLMSFEYILSKLTKKRDTYEVSLEIISLNQTLFVI